MFGLLSSVTTALHAVVIKRSLDAVNGSTLQLAWYSNVMSSLIMAPLVILMGEVPGIMNLLFGPSAPANTDGSFSLLATFLWGSAITVSDLRILSASVLPFNYKPNYRVLSDS